MKQFVLTIITILIYISVQSQTTIQGSQHPYTLKSVGVIKGLSDDKLLDVVQRQTFRYFWDYSHPVSGMARERRNNVFDYGNEVVTTGGTGFGIMATIVAVHRSWISRDSAARHILKIVKFLEKADSYHGAFPQWLDGATGRIIPYSRKNDGADLVHTSYLFQGLLTARQYFNNNTPAESDLRNRINWLWNDIEWSWFTRDGEDVLYWHWSPDNGWAMNTPIIGYNECLLTYILAAGHDKYPVKADVYHNGWTRGANFKNGKYFYNIMLPLGVDYGGPLYIAHYSFLGLDPRGLKDNYANYWEQNVNHTLINRAYCIDNPGRFTGYGKNTWGLSASDNHEGFAMHSPDNDHGVISPTAALSSFPYTPEYSMQVLKNLYYNLGDKIWSDLGFVDAFNESKDWYAQSHVAIDQGPIIIMIENHRSALIWDLFMSCEEVQKGLKKLEFKSPALK